MSLNLWWCCALPGMVLPWIKCSLIRESTSEHPNFCSISVHSSHPNRAPLTHFFCFLVLLSSCASGFLRLLTTYPYHPLWGKSSLRQGLVCFLPCLNPNLWVSAWHSLDSQDIYSESMGELVNEQVECFGCAISNNVANRQGSPRCWPTYAAFHNRAAHYVFKLSLPNLLAPRWHWTKSSLNPANISSAVLTAC